MRRRSDSLRRGRARDENLERADVLRGRAIARDVASAPRWRDKLGYLIRPPGWQPGDASRTAAGRKRALSRELAGPLGAATSPPT